MIDVSLSFTPIHTFAPQYGEDFINRVDRPQRNLQPMPSRPVPTRI